MFRTRRRITAHVAEEVTTVDFSKITQTAKTFLIDLKKRGTAVTKVITI